MTCFMLTQIEWRKVQCSYTLHVAFLRVKQKRVRVYICVYVCVYMCAIVNTLWLLFFFLIRRPEPYLGCSQRGQGVPLFSSLFFFSACLLVGRYVWCHASKQKEIPRFFFLLCRLSSLQLLVVSLQYHHNVISPFFFTCVCLSGAAQLLPSAPRPSCRCTFFSPACLCSTVALATCGPRFVFPIFVSSLIYSVLNRCFFFFILPFGVGVVCFLYSFCFSCVVCDCQGSFFFFHLLKSGFF